MDNTPDHEDNVGLPLNLLKGLWETKLVDEGTEVDEETGESHTLGTHLEGEDLDWVESLERCPSERVDGLEDVNHSNNGSRRSLVLLVIGVNTTGGNDTNPADCTSNVDPDEKWTTTDSVDEASTDGRDNNLNSVHGNEQVGTSSLVLDTSLLQDTSQEVGDDTVTSPLTEKGSDAVGGETVAGSTVLEECAVVPPSLVSTIELQVRLVFEQLKLDPLRIWVAVAVVLGQESLSLFLLAIAVEPSWRLWEEHSEDDHETREESLKPERDDPGLSSWEIHAATVGTGGNDSTDWPVCLLVNTGDNNLTRLTRRRCRDRQRYHGRLGEKSQRRNMDLQKR